MFEYKKLTEDCISKNLDFRKSFKEQHFLSYLGYEMDWDNPKTFNQKIQWLQLYDYNPLITKCADKYLAREYTKEKIGDKYLIPLLGVWDSPDKIDFDALPNQFVLKVNWGWSQNIICKDKSNLNIQEVKLKLNEWLQASSNNYFAGFELSYKYIEPKITCEKYIEQLDGGLFDYKVFCFNGEPRYIQIDSDRYTNFKRSFYDTKWEVMGFTTANWPLYAGSIEAPNELDEMLSMARILSNPFSFVRVDFYVIENQLHVGELAFHPDGGFGKFEPEEWDYKFGELLELPTEKRIEYFEIDRDLLIQSACSLESIAHQLKPLVHISADLKKYRLQSNWFPILFGISNNSTRLRITIFGIKLTWEMTPERINKLASFIPIPKWRDVFINKFK